jgi:hypothetical protein
LLFPVTIHIFPQKFVSLAIFLVYKVLINPTEAFAGQSEAYVVDNVSGKKEDFKEDLIWQI